jgi:hypothetical protein
MALVSFRSFYLGIRDTVGSFCRWIDGLLFCAFAWLVAASGMNFIIFHYYSTPTKIWTKFDPLFECALCTRGIFGIGWFLKVFLNAHYFIFI